MIHLCPGVKVDQLGAELAAERSASQSKEGSKQQLERQNRELKAKLQEMEGQGRSKLKSSIATLETKLREVEEQLETESRWWCMMGNGVKTFRAAPNSDDV